MKKRSAVWIGATTAFIIFLQIGIARADSGGDTGSFDRFVEITQQKLEDLRQDMKPMMEKIESMGTEAKKEAKSEWKKLMEDYSETREQVAKDLSELKGKSGEAWKQGKKKVNSAVEKLEKKYRELRSRPD